MKNFVERLREIDREYVRVAILTGARTGTAIGTTFVSIGFLYCTIMFLAYGVIANIEWAIRAVLMVPYACLGLYYSFAYCKNDSSTDLDRSRRLSTGDMEVDQALQQCVSMSVVVFTMTGIVLAAFFVFWPVLLAKPLLLVLWVVVTVPTVMLFGLDRKKSTRCMPMSHLLLMSLTRLS